MRSARWPSVRNFLDAGRAEFPEFLQIFRQIFAQILRDLGAGLALYLALERAPTQKRGAAVCATTLAEFTQFFCARRAEVFRKIWEMPATDPSGEPKNLEF